MAAAYLEPEKPETGFHRRCFGLVPLVGQERRQQPVFLAAFLVRSVQPAA